MNTYNITTQLELTEEIKQYTGLELENHKALEKWKFLRKLSGEKILVIEQFKILPSGECIFKDIENNITWNDDEGPELPPMDIRKVLGKKGVWVND